MNLLEKLSIWTSAAIFFLAAMAGSALAIPSPELVIGSAASMSQLFAMATAALGGATVLGARRLQLSAKSARRMVFVLIGLFVLLLVAVGGNLYQYRLAQNDRIDRLQATLVRPAVILDSLLKETSLSDQTRSGLGIDTDTAASRIGTDTVFIDVRETAENATGTIPGAAHRRFPDLSADPGALTGKNVVLFCHNGNRSSEACADLAALGIDCNFIVGGIEKWIVERRPFTDANVRGLEDLRAIPAYHGSQTLLDTKQFRKALDRGPVQLVDVRYPGDFATGHLPGAVNIPLRATPSAELGAVLDALGSDPVIAPCYDRRGCFLAQVLGYELSQRGIPFLGRYTVPWEYFEPPAQKPHIAEWLKAQNESTWSRVVGWLSGWTAKAADAWGLPAALVLLALVSRGLVLPIAVKAERDQIRMAALKPELDAVKQKYSHDPATKSAMLARFNRDHGLTPWRNMLALLFLPVTMLGVAAVERVAGAGGDLGRDAAVLGVSHSLLTGLVAGVMGALYLQLALARSRRGAVLSWLLGVPAVAGLSLSLSQAGAFYVVVALSLLLLQRVVVAGQAKRGVRLIKAILIQAWCRRFRMGVLPLAAPVLLKHSGNKAFRLALLRRKGFPVPDGVVLNDAALARFDAASPRAQNRLCRQIARALGGQVFAVRSSSSIEDGADQSFAGVFDSRLDVQADQLSAAILDVQSSFQAAHTRAYSEDTGAANILIQPMLEAEFAGVMFTQAPDAPAQMLVEYVEGAGEGLVSGRKSPKSLRFGWQSRAPIAGQPPFDVSALLDLGRRVEAIFKTPQDVEWVYRDGQFFVVQTRDITQQANTTSPEISKEWTRTLARFAGARSDEVLLVQDENAEVLPQPTDLSLDYMRALWATGGSVERACVSLGLRYRPPAVDAPFLVRVFGRLYVDKALKARSDAVLTKRARRNLNRDPEAIADGYRHKFLPVLDARLARIAATQFHALPQDALRREVVELFDEFVATIHVEAERVNIAAGYYTARALDLCQAQGVEAAPLLRSGGLAEVLPDSVRGNPDQLRLHFGHRALFDYELSEPRFQEAPRGLDALVASVVVQPVAPIPTVLPTDVRQAVQHARLYQSLKEGAKNQTLRFVAEIRRALVELDRKWGFDGLVFELQLQELRQFEQTPDTLRPVAQRRADQRRIFLAASALSPVLTVTDVETASGGFARRAKRGPATGQVVAGRFPIDGRVFAVEREVSETGGTLDGFRDGDILVCSWLHPTWLPYLLRSGGVLTERGGWLSHMAIVAREHDIAFCVGVNTWSDLSTGDLVTVSASGGITKARHAVGEKIMRTRPGIAATGSKGRGSGNAVGQSVMRERRRADKR